MQESNQNTQMPSDANHDEPMIDLDSATPYPRPTTKGRVQLSQTIIVRAAFLLPITYRSTQLATQLGLAKKDCWRVREWARRGMPHHHDTTGHLMIDGVAFARWVAELTRKRPRRKLPLGHMWCPGCNSPQLPQQAKIEIMSGRRTRTAVCPRGHRMSQWVSRRAI